MEPSWRWIFPGSHQHCCLICHFVQWIKAISCSALKPLVHFMNNSCKYHFRSQSSKMTGKGYSWDVQKKKKGDQIVSARPGGVFVNSSVWAGAQGGQSRHWSPVPGTKPLLQPLWCPCAPLKRRAVLPPQVTWAGGAFATTVSPRVRCHPVRPISARLFQSNTSTPSSSADPLLALTEISSN